eukprot:CAMPEP_0203744292 /NCGR_PEP_ID=MMETSP0098-20131031/418_1 /ASSEMBLY_ACC=CAM_ASM_000208 /TAXON_ID=96639 /ORGANISM=" , Strain NY0313808BC1" /LENGTH=210 /DNA_ID=CAMNT_0050631775 /DNA_START=34 /DNA_END=663 /DNA_ORIENTATION=+
MGNQRTSEFTYDKCINPAGSGCAALLSTIDLSSSARPSLNFVGDNVKVGLYFRLNHKLFETAPVRPNSSDVLHYANCKSEVRFTLPIGANMGGVAVKNTATKSIVTFNVEEGGVLSGEQLRFKKSVCRGLVNCNAFEQHMISLRDFESHPGSETHSYEVTTPMVFVQNQIACVIPFTMVKGTVESSRINWRVGGQQCWNSNGKLYCKCAG